MLPKGSVICEEKKRGKEIYVLSRGSAYITQIVEITDVQNFRNNFVVKICEVGDNEFIGEEVLLQDHYSYTVRVQSMEAIVLSIPIGLI